MTEQLSLDGQRIIITGAGNGIGRAHALLLAERGANVLINDLNREAADAVVADVRASGGVAAASYEAVGTKSAGLAIVEAACDAFGGLDAIISNAGHIRPALFEEMSEADIDSILTVHLSGSLYLAQAAWIRMKRQNYGRILLTSSASGMFGHPGMVNYSAAKSGTFGLMKALACEGEGHNIRVNALLPVAVTSINQQIEIPGLAEHYAKFISPELHGKIQEKANMHPEMISYLAAYLVSRQCEVTGEAYSINRGRYGRIFVGVADGWLTRKGDEISAEAVVDHLTEIRDISHYTAPKWSFEETAEIARRL